MSSWSPRELVALVLCILLFAAPMQAAETGPELLDILLENGSITQEQYDLLVGKDAADAEEADEGSSGAPPAAAVVTTGDGDTASEGADGGEAAGSKGAAGEVDEATDRRITERVAEAVAKQIEENFPVKASYGKKGFRLETRDGNWQTNLQWRAQFRSTWPTTGDPRQADDFADDEKLTFEARRLRMKIGGHGYRPWLKYYFEVDLQPSRDSDDSSSSSSARVIDWRIDVAKFKPISLRVGQWKIDYNRERVDSSGRQQFVERSIVNRVFTIDRQIGLSVRGHLFEGTHADMRYYFGAFTGEGRGVRNDDENLMYAARLQWNFLGRDLGLRQTDVERTELPTASLAIGGALNTGKCTRWSSGGCSNLDGFLSPGAADNGQYRVRQAVQEFAFKWQGFSVQQEFHWKRIIDRSFDNGNARHRSQLWGLYAQSGYFFNEIVEWVPEELEIAFRYAWVREPNEVNRLKKNTRQEFTTALNWFFWGHNNKITLDYSYLTLDDDVLSTNTSDHRSRLQWDISF